jgi:hypothetical protein
MSRVKKTPEEGSIIDTIRTLHKEERRSLYVPEWDVEVYVSPVTFEDLDEIERRKPDDPKAIQTTSDKTLLLLVLKARRESGEPLFRYVDIPTLKREASTEVVNRIIDFVWGEPATVEAADKELEESPFDSSSSVSPES